jgi:hypothetical protein
MLCRGGVFFGFECHKTYEWIFSLLLGMQDFWKNFAFDFDRIILYLPIDGIFLLPLPEGWYYGLVGAPGGFFSQKVLNILMRFCLCGMQVAHGRVATENGISVISVFVLRANGRKVTEDDEKKRLCLCMYTEVDHPLRVAVVTRGPDTELHIATPIESCGRGRPRVLHDITLALKQLDICIFKVSKLKTQTLFFLWRPSTHICSGSSVVANVRAVYYIPIYADPNQNRSIIVWWSRTIAIYETSWEKAVWPYQSFQKVDGVVSLPKSGMWLLQPECLCIIIIFCEIQ